MFNSFAPGEVIFFGEHSVVYGKRALACAISKGITAQGAWRKDNRIKIKSDLGEVEAVLGINGLRGLKGDKQLKALPKIFERLMNRFGEFQGLDIRISSEIPAESGLASSAAVSSALARLGLTALNKKISDSELVDLVFQSELDIQKRGSILGSACTALGGIVSVQSAKWVCLAAPMKTPDIWVIDTQTRCATSITTGHVKKRLIRSRRSTQALFDRMDILAQRGTEALYRSDWFDMGSQMNENQECLNRLGVSTVKIEAVHKKIRNFVYGSKITGAGGGGCLVALPKDPKSLKLKKIIRELKCLVFMAKPFFLKKAGI